MQGVVCPLLLQNKQAPELPNPMFTRIMKYFPVASQKAQQKTCRTPK